MGRGGQHGTGAGAGKAGGRHPLPRGVFGIAVPTDRELPENELENIIRRSRASAVIYSPKKAEDIKKVKENIPEVEYFIEMKSDKPLEGKDVGINALISLGKNIIKTGNNSFAEIEIAPEEFRILFFTSGTTSYA